jgi:spermidine/putrescine-binding protein
MKKCFLSKIFVFLLFTYFACAYSEKPTLNILLPMNLVPHSLIEEFEKQHSEFLLRFDFYVTSSSFEKHIQNRVYDIVIAEDDILEALSEKNLLLSIKRDFLREIGLDRLVETKPSAAKEGVTFYKTFLINPVVLIHTPNPPGLKTEVKTPSWDWLIDPQKNPMWRQRIFLNLTTEEILTLSRIETQTTISPQDNNVPPLILEWVSKLKNQKAFQVSNPLQGFLSSKISAMVGYLSDYIFLKRYLKKLRYAIPTNGTFYKKIGIGILERTLNPRYSKMFISYILEKMKPISAYSEFIEEKKLLSHKNWIPGLKENIYSTKILNKVEKIINPEEP